MAPFEANPYSEYKRCYFPLKEVTFTNKKKSKIILEMLNASAYAAPWTLKLRNASKAKSAA
jgi:hypothetical protein